MVETKILQGLLYCSLVQQPHSSGLNEARICDTIIVSDAFAGPPQHLDINHPLPRWIPVYGLL